MKWQHWLAPGANISRNWPATRANLSSAILAAICGWQRSCGPANLHFGRRVRRFSGMSGKFAVLVTLFFSGRHKPARGANAALRQDPADRQGRFALSETRLLQWRDPRSPPG